MAYIGKFGQVRPHTRYGRRRRPPRLGMVLALAIMAFAGLCYDQFNSGVGIWSDAGGVPASTDSTGNPPARAVSLPRSNAALVPSDGPAVSESLWQPSVRIVDGDTFWHDGEKIRVADIDTPEVNGRCPYESALAARATSRFGELLRAGPFDLLPISGRDEDRYGRKLRIVVRNGRSLGDVLVEEGLARTWSGRREPWC